MKRFLLVSLFSAALLMMPLGASAFKWGKIGIKGAYRTFDFKKLEVTKQAAAGSTPEETAAKKAAQEKWNREFEAEYSSLRHGGGAGVAFDFYLPIPGLSIQPEINFLFANSYSMMEVPINIQAGLDLVLVRPFICVTPYFDIPFSGGAGLDRRGFQGGIGVGGGVDIWKFQLQCRYNWNFSDFYKDASGKLRGLDLSLIFFF